LHQSQQKLCILTVGLLLLHSLGLDLCRIADPQLESQFCQQSLEPARISGSLHSYPNVDSSLLQISIESFCFAATVAQFLFTTFASLFHKKRNRLKARVVIYAYQVHVRLLSPEPLVVMQPKFTRVEEPTLLCNHVARVSSSFRLARFVTVTACRPSDGNH